MLMAAVVIVAVVIRSNLIKVMVGGGICGIVSGGGVRHDCSGYSHVHHLHHH